MIFGEYSNGLLKLDNAGNLSCEYRLTNAGGGQPSSISRAVKIRHVYASAGENSWITVCLVSLSKVMTSANSYCLIIITAGLHTRSLDILHHWQG
jgi:hypothetical protein